VAGVYGGDWVTFKVLYVVPYVWWQEVTEGQAIIVASLVTVIGALLAIIMGSFLFGGRVKSLEDAVRNSQEAVSNHLDGQDSSLRDLGTIIQERLQQVDEMSRQLNEVIAALSERLNSIQDTLEDDSQIDSDTLGSDQTEIVELREDRGYNFEAFEEPIERFTLRESFKRDWLDIREIIDTAATSTEVDGRRRARYLRIDRRNYKDYFEAIAHDGNIPEPVDQFRRAVDLWTRHRTARAPISRADVEEMRELRDLLVRLR